VPYRSVNPATGEALKTFTEHTDQEMMDALATADKAFVSWAARPTEQRAKIISRAAQLLLERKSELAKLATLEMGKRIAESYGEVELSAANFVRVVFLSYPKGSGFTGGEQAPTASLNCVLRSGHIPEEKTDMLQQLWTMFQGLTGIATDQLVLSLQEIPSSNAMEMGQIMQAVGHE